MRLQKLTGLERKKVEDEYKATIKLIQKLETILKSKQLQLKIIEDELLEIKEKFGDERRTEIVYKAEEFRIEDMIAEEAVVISISHSGFVKRVPVSGYRRQGRGGRGVTGAVTRQNDFMAHMFVANTHDYILIFTDKGRCYWLKVFEIPEAGRTAKGKAISSLISTGSEESIASFIAVRAFSDDQYVFMVTRDGLMKRVALSEFSNPRKNGITAANLKGSDRLTDVRLTDGTMDIIIGTSSGMAIRFHEDEIRPMGRSASGVRGIRLGKNDAVVGAVSLQKKGGAILVSTQRGYGKRSNEGDYRISHRGGKGIKTVKVTEKTGPMVALRAVGETDDIVVVTSKGMVIRQHASDVRRAGRNTQGVRLIKLDAEDAVADVAVVIGVGEEEKRVAHESDKLAAVDTPTSAVDNAKKDPPTPTKKQTAKPEGKTKAKPKKTVKKKPTAGRSKNK
jgi:DNA gyrase subunit A